MMFARTWFFRLAAVLVPVGIVFTGCVKQEVKKAGPEVPAFQFEQYVHNEGLRGRFASETHDVIMVTPDKRATTSTFKFTGAVMGRLTKEQKNVEIVRLDRDLIWQANMNKKRYLEIPIQKMTQQVGVVRDDPSGETVYVEDCCSVKTSMQRPGIKKIVNGYNAEQVILKAVSSCKEGAGEDPSKAIITMDIWFAPGVDLGQELDAFNTAYAKKAGMDVQAMQAVGDQFRQMYPGFRDLALMMQDIKGYPILTVLTVEDEGYLKRQEAERRRQQESEGTGGAGSPTEMVTGFLAKKLKEREEAKRREEDAKWGNIVWRISWESRNFKKARVPAGEFELAGGLQKVEQKEYLEGEQGQAIVESKPAHYVKTACLPTVTEKDIGLPLYPGARVARERPYSETDHNTEWYYRNKDDYRIRYSTPDPMEKVVAFYEGKMKVKCAVTTRKEDGQEYREAVCSKAAGAGRTQTFRMNEKPLLVEIGTGFGPALAEDAPPEKLLGFVLSTRKQ